MNQRKAPDCHHRDPSSKEMLVSEANLDMGEITILEICRYFFVSFTSPCSHAWMKAFVKAESMFPPDSAAEVAWRTAAFLQGMRTSRRSIFQFNSPNCPGCARILSEHERQLLGVLVATRCNRESEAMTHAMVICEGNSTDSLLAATRDLSDAMGERLLDGFELRSNRQTAQV
ncbi:MAG: hypothetical protein AAF334_02795 [Pseudomonadota bacterium]